MRHSRSEFPLSRIGILLSTCWGLCVLSVVGPRVGLAQNDPPVDTRRSFDQKYVESAPPDAYEAGSRFAYYGSENPWNRRMFYREDDPRYKRYGQRQLLSIVDGDPQQAVDWCQQTLRDLPGDPESLFVLSIALAQIGDEAAALAAVRDALDAGLPWERYLAGPRDLMQQLDAIPTFQRMRWQHAASRLVHGPLLGCLTDRSVRVWVRTANESDVTVDVVPAAGDGDRSWSGSGRTSKQRDYTCSVALDGLPPDTELAYRVTIDGEPANTVGRCRFRTLPPVGKGSRFRVAFGGGAGYTPHHERVWSAIEQRRPTALLLLGDNVYIDLPQMPGPVHDYTYYRRQSQPEFRSLVSSVPVYAIWDDHDAAIDDVWLGPYSDRPAWKQPLLRHFLRNWNNPAPHSATFPGCWHSFVVGDVAFFMLDCRTYRTNPFTTPRTMLGPTQKAWLLDSMASSRAAINVIVSSVAWARGAKPGSHDTWDGFADEREEIFRAIEQRERIEQDNAPRRVGPVLLVSADRHRSDAWRIDREEGKCFYDFMSSRLTNVHRHENMPGSLFSYNETCSFGLLTFDTTLKDATVKYEIIDLDGNCVHRLTLQASELNRH